ncbi:EAL domain-containing protein [Caulobacter sp. KR2-114]|uniref:flagella assembly cyclic-di-GMP phosphodiesterase TipF n=1 Tax=Caulobacter sp. KR2-114 TaxID=3400912 RepID=UPI003C0E2400
MRTLILALLTGAYICLAAIVALVLWRVAGDGGAGVAGGIAVLGVCFAFHGLIARAMEANGLRAELAALRDAHLILAGQIEKIDARFTETVESVHDDALRRSEELETEVHHLEDIVVRMGRQLEDQLAHRVEEARVTMPAPATLAARQTNALLETVREALAANRVDLYLQPIVSLPQRKTVFYESYSRLRDETGRVMMPAEYLTVAEPGGLVTAIDNLLLFRCVQIVRRLAKQDRKVGIFCNISLASLGDEEFFPQFLEFMTANRDLGGALIFELGQAAFDKRGGVEARHMAKLADLGFRFSIDKVYDLDLDFQDMTRADVKFIKIGAEMLLDELQDTEDGAMVFRDMPDLAASDYAALARRYGIEIMAEKVESERQVVDVLDLDIGYGQGHLFGEPRAIRDAVLAEAPPPEFIRTSLLRRVG